ncbi:MAG: prenyltransferase [Gemmatimonadetes bacterium]|nr:prenyltransferase [Gemmatimonadota bacterium]
MATNLALDRAAARPRDLAVWMQAARVKSLAISSIAVLAGAAAAAYDGHGSRRIVVAWLGSVAIQAGTNLVNVYHNYKANADPNARFKSDPRGSSAVVARGLLTPAHVRAGALACFGVGVACGLLLAALCGWPILAIGIPAVAAGYFYAAPPVRLAYRGLGVATVFVFLGPVMVGGAYYVAAGGLSAGAVAAAVAVGLTAAGIMHINDVRDYDSDVVHGKRTLATLLGRDGATRALVAMDAAAYGAVLAGAALGALPWTALLVLLTVPTALAEVRMVARERDFARLNQAWFRGIELHTRFGALLVAGLVAGRVLGV